MIVTLSVRVPALKAPLVDGLNVPVKSLKFTVDGLVKLVTVLSLASLAVIVMVKAVPATLGLVIFPIVK